MKQFYSFCELGKAAKITARNNLLCEMESLFCHWKKVKSFISDAFNTGIAVRPEDVYVTDDDNVIFLPHQVVMDVALKKSGVDKQCLVFPEHRELFLSNAKANIRQVSPFPSDVRFVIISIAVNPFENNDNGHALFQCEMAASLLEIYLNNLVATISNSFRMAILKEHSRISSPVFLDNYLDNQGEVFLSDGSIAPMFQDKEAV